MLDFHLPLDGWIVLVGCDATLIVAIVIRLAKQDKPGISNSGLEIRTACGMLSLSNG